MKEADLGNVEHGVYVLFWKSGGESLAAVGSDRSGKRWYAPTNWVSVPSYNWRLVSKVEEIVHPLALKR